MRGGDVEEMPTIMTGPEIVDGEAAQQDAQPTLVTLATLADGAPEELFQSALEQVLSNLDDPNTDWKAPRTITLSVKVTTNEERRMAQFEITCSSKLAGARGVTTPVYVGRHLGKLAAVEAPRQEDMFPRTKGGPVAVQRGGV